MKIAVVVSVFNEESTIGLLLKSLLAQTRKPDEIIIVDGGSCDKTCEIIKNFQLSENVIHLLEVKSTRAEARNIGVSAAKSEIIATTDAGCVAEKHWLERLCKPFASASVDLVAGFYKMVGESHFKKALSVFLGINPERFDDRFLASARSLAFRKTIWKKVGGFPKELKGAGEDTVFNYKMINVGAKIIRVKNAIVYWKLPDTYAEAAKKMFLYAKGDATSGIWWHPVKKFSTHNIKIALIFLRYLIGLTLLFMALSYKFLQFPLILAFFFYIFCSFRKVYRETNDFIAGIYGIVLQFTSDISVMSGFFVGLIGL
jgi:glycosyltransferase involved in cell wall biosynthesis